MKPVGIVSCEFRQFSIPAYLITLFLLFLDEWEIIFSYFGCLKIT